MAPPSAVLLLALSFSYLAAQSLAASPRVLSMPFTKRNTNTSHALNKRNPFAASLENFLPGSAYFVTAAVGTPHQIVELVIDTGSSDSWMFASGACVEGKSGPCLGGSYESTKSSTSKPFGSMGLFQSKYGDGSQVQGPYYQDDWSVGDSTIHEMTFGTVTKYKGRIRSGILGMGIDKNEASVALHGKLYPTFMDELKAQGIISSRSFSLYMDDLAASTGSVLFGGYDTEKFSGDVIPMLPIQTDVLTGEKVAYTVSLSGFGVSLKGQTDYVDSSNAPFPVVLDSGTTISYIAPELFEPLIKAFGLECQNSACLVDCNIQQFQSGTTIDFIFGSENGGAKIAVPIGELAIPLFNPNDGNQYEGGGQSVCVFGLLPQTVPGIPYILGQSFLRSAYVLYDIDNLAVGIAQAKYGNTGSHVVEYSSSGTNPGVTTDVSEPQAKETNPGGSPGRVVKPEVSITFVKPIPSAFDDVPFPNSRPTDSFPTSLTPQITPVGGESGGNKGSGGGSSGGSNGSGSGGSHSSGGSDTSSGGGGGSTPTGGGASSPAGSGGGTPSASGSAPSNAGRASRTLPTIFSSGLLTAGTLILVSLGALALL